MLQVEGVLVLVLVRRQLVVFGVLLRLHGAGGRCQQSQSLAERRRVRRTGQRIEPGQVLQTRQWAQMVSQFAGGSGRVLVRVVEWAGPQFGISWWLLENA